VKDWLHTLWASGAAVGLTSVFSPVVAALSLVDQRAADPALRAWANSVLGAAGVETQVEGLEHLPQGNFVLAVNHQSHFDALVIFRHVERHLRFVAKRELTRIPVFGFALRKAGNIIVERTGSEGDKRKISQAAQQVRDRVSVVFFAEGTRSEDGVLRPFKKGAAVLAIDAQVPLVPAAVSGTAEILRKGTLAIRAHPAALVLGPALSTVGLIVDDRDALTQRAHDAVSRCLERAQALVQMRLSSAGDGEHQQVR